MNCETFKNIVNDLARASVMGTEAREGGLAHAETCARCAARLAYERKLSVALRETIISMKSAEAPPRVEEALRVAFQERSATVRFAPSAVRSSVGARHRTRWAIGTAAAAAAMILILFTLIAPRLRHTTIPEQANSGNEKAVPHDGPNSRPRESAPRPVDIPVNHEQEIVRQPQFRRRTGLTQAAAMSDRTTISAKDLPIIDVATIYGETEVATDFLPLMQTGNSAPVNSGQVVRVEMPRSALASFGLPMNADRFGERIQADVLLAEDGSARAIRFIR